MFKQLAKQKQKSRLGKALAAHEARKTARDERRAARRASRTERHGGRRRRRR